MSKFNVVTNVIQDFRRDKPLQLISLFLLFYSIALSLSPLVLKRNLSESLLWQHWLGYLTWLICISGLNYYLKRSYSHFDKRIFQIVSLLVGWGLLTIWRLTLRFGLRQTIWLFVASFIAYLMIKYDRYFIFLRRYKYIWLILGLSLTSLTFIFGTNPQGIGPRLWLGCCGVYLQPSEPLKLLLILFLAAYLADRKPLSNRLAPLLAPTAVLFLTALLMLIVQRDLGTAFIFLLIYTFVIFIATEKKTILLVGIPLLAISGYAGSLLFDVVRLRMDAWINPWLDPSGRSYQIVQSLITIASGGFFGRGPGLGNPDVVPVSHSDFIFISIFEETGLIGAIAILIGFTMLCLRGLQIAARSNNLFHRYLAAGLVAYFSMQTLLIIGGNIRLLPLTGVTLPFMSYGGSSLVTSFIAAILLLRLSQDSKNYTNNNYHDSIYLGMVGKFLIISFVLVAITLGWWSLVKAPELRTRTDNPRRAIADLYVPRGKLLYRDGSIVAETIGSVGSFERNYSSTLSGAVFGYSHPIYGLAGVEASYNNILRGLDNQPKLNIWINDLLYGQPPTGVDVRLTIDPHLQSRAETLLSGLIGGVILMNASNGEILVMASSPSFDPNQLTEAWDSIIQEIDGPLVNRITQAKYQPGTALGPFLLAEAITESVSIPVPIDLNHSLNGTLLNCAKPLANATNDWADVIAAGCPGAVAELGLAIGSDALLQLFDMLKFYETPDIQLPLTSSAAKPIVISIPEAAAIGQSDMTISPLQLARAITTLSNGGFMPPARIAYNYEQSKKSDQLSLTSTENSQQVFSESIANMTANNLAHDTLPIWQSLATAIKGPDQFLSWYLAGSLPDQNGVKYVVVVVLEIDFPTLAEAIGQAMMRTAMVTE